jgi:hypothetical protein
VAESATTPTNINGKKPNTKQELIAANIKLLIEHLEAGQVRVMQVVSGNFPR